MSRHLCTVRRALTTERIAHFLAGLRRHGSAARAARDAGVPRQTAYDARARDLGFAASWAAAIAAARRGPEPCDPLALAQAARVAITTSDNP